MFSLGPWEMAIVGIVAVLLFGKKLPEVMRSLGKSYNEFRKGLSDIQSSVHYSDYEHSSSHSAPKSQDFDDYDEPTAPRFEPPPPSNEQPKPPADASGTSSGGIAE